MQLLVTLNLSKMRSFRTSCDFCLDKAAMPVQLLKIAKGQSEIALPSHLQKENLQNLREGCDNTNKYIQVN